MAKVISFMNNKGGVGKTTSAHSVGFAWAAMGKKILFIDLDSQANLTSMLSEQDPLNVEWENTIEDVLIGGIEGGIEACIKPTDNPLVSFIPADLDLANYESDSSKYQLSEYLLLDILEPVKSKYDFIILDCPPAIQKLTYNALVASDYLVLVSTLDGKSYKGLQMMANLYNAVVQNKRLNPSLVLIGIIATMYQRDKVNEFFWQQLKENFGPYVLEPYIHKSTMVNRATSFNKSIYDIDPKGKVATDYLNVSQDLMVRILDDIRSKEEAGKSA